MDFAADPEVVRVVAQGEYLAYGHLFNPAFAIETSLIEPLPHQRMAVYEAMLQQSRLRFLLADDAGAGKTIMAGLYIREMMARRLIRRVLIVPPAGLVGNWYREMRSLFNLTFHIVVGSDAKRSNPFVGRDSDLAIVSVDTLAREGMFSQLQPSEVQPYDLVIFDEAHKLSADREPDYSFRRTDRYRLAEALAGTDSQEKRWQLRWGSQHLLLLTATPHMGKDYPYYCLWRLLQPEVLSTIDAFNAYPEESRRHHFIRRTKEDMVWYTGKPIYPMRETATLSYELTQGESGEQTLYDETTDYIQLYYNRAGILNRSAARLAMSVFQRRLASSTYALMRSFERRLDKLDGLIADIEAGRVTFDQLQVTQHQLETVDDVLETKTADEEVSEADQEENERVEEQILSGVAAVNLEELEAERCQVQDLLALAQQVYDQGDESKFERLRQVIRDPDYCNEKMIIFTEHRDTLDFLLRRLQGLGFTGQVAQIYGGMDFRDRDAQVEFFRKPTSEGGATYLLATDAAGEGINLQFCWLMVNYDIPWNPARLEQRMGRIHRFGQKHDPVIILNLVAGKTREGRVLKTLLDKLERIRKELGSDKVFDVVGRVLEGVSIKSYIEQALTEQGANDATSQIEALLTEEQVTTLQEQEKKRLGPGGDVRSQLPRLQADIQREIYKRLLPGHVRRFVERAFPLVGIQIDGDLEDGFELKPLMPGALDPLWPVLGTYPEGQRHRFTVVKPKDRDGAVFLHPGEPCFDRLRGYVCARFESEALRGSVFVDPKADKPYLLHLVLVSVIRAANPEIPGLARQEVLEYQLVGLKQVETGQIEECPVEHLMLLKGGKDPSAIAHWLPQVGHLQELARVYGLERVAQNLADKRAAALRQSLPERMDFLKRGFAYQEADLAAARSRQGEKAKAGDSRAKGEVTRIRERQRRLADQRHRALQVLEQEPDLILPGEVSFVTHALVVPTQELEERKRQDREVEAIAVKVAWAYEEAHGATVKDVSTPELARLAGQGDHPGFDLLSLRPGGEERAIEVKGRARVGDVELTENEWLKACNLRDRYWLYVVYDCVAAHPRLMRVQDPFRKLVVQAKSSFMINQSKIFQVAEHD